jgi:ribonuclease D
VAQSQTDGRPHWKHLLERYHQVQLDKSEQTSNWLSSDLSRSQLKYAAADFQHLLELRERLMDEAIKSGVADLAEISFGYLPTRVETDIRRCGDLFAY